MITIKNILNPINICCEAAESLYPEIKKYNTKIVWTDGTDYNKRKILGTINITKDKEILIKLNPYQDFLDLLDTVQHELAHIVQYSRKEKMKHNKKFDKIYKKIKSEWRNKMIGGKRKI